MAEPEASNPPTPQAFISWAHGGSDWSPQQVNDWRQRILDFATALRQIGGVDADLDLWHATTHENWSTFGVAGIRDSDFILSAVSGPYRQRWEETGSPHEGAGAAREANAIKAVFDRDRSQFQRRVKVVLLPGATIDDIPMEMLASIEHFRIPSFDLSGMDKLLRSLHGMPAWPKPPLGGVPALPPAYVANISAAAGIGGEAADAPVDEPQSALRRRLTQIDDELTTLTPSADRLQAYERQPLADERDVIASSLVALDHVASRIEGDRASSATRQHVEDELQTARTEARNALNEAQQAMTTLPPIAKEALFQYFHTGQPLTVGGTLDRFGLEDAVRSEEAGYLSWVEDVEQTVSARQLNPRVDAAITALQRVRRSVFGGVSWKGRAEAAPWARTLLRDEYVLDDPEFELRPVWVALGFLSQ